MLDEELDRRVRAAVQAVPTVAAPAGGLQAVKARAKQLRRRRVLPVVAVLALCVVLGSAVVLDARSDPGDRVAAVGGEIPTTTVGQAGAGLSTPLGARPFLYGPLAASPLSDAPLPEVRGLVVSENASYTVIVNSTKDAGKEISVRVQLPGLAGVEAGAPPSVANVGLAAPTDAPIRSATGGTAPEGLSYLFGVTRVEVATIIVTTAQGQQVRTTTLQNGALPTLRFFITEVPATPALDDGEVPQPPTLAAYNDAGQEVLRWERCLRACPRP